MYPSSKTFLCEWLLDLLVRILFVSIKTKAISCFLVDVHSNLMRKEKEILLSILFYWWWAQVQKAQHFISKSGGLGWLSEPEPVVFCHVKKSQPLAFTNCVTLVCFSLVWFFEGEITWCSLKEPFKLPEVLNSCQLRGRIGELFFIKIIGGSFALFA